MTTALPPSLACDNSSLARAVHPSHIACIAFPTHALRRSPAFPLAPPLPDRPPRSDYSEGLGLFSEDDADESDDGGFMTEDEGAGRYEEACALALQAQRQAVKAQLDHFFPLTVYQVQHGGQMPLERDHPLHGPEAQRRTFEQEREQFVAVARRSLVLDPLDNDFSQVRSRCPLFPLAAPLPRPPGHPPLPRRHAPSPSRPCAAVGPEQHWLYRLYIETNLFWDFSGEDAASSFVAGGAEQPAGADVDGDGADGEAGNGGAAEHMASLRARREQLRWSRDRLQRLIHQRQQSREGGAFEPAANPQRGAAAALSTSASAANGHGAGVDLSSGLEGLGQQLTVTTILLRALNAAPGLFSMRRFGDVLRSLANWQHVQHGSQASQVGLGLQGSGPASRSELPL